MRRLVMFVFMVLSLLTMVSFTLSINQLMQDLGIGSFDWEATLQLIQSLSLEDLLPALGTVLWGLFQLYGIPLIVFLVSLNGLMAKDR